MYPILARYESIFIYSFTVILAVGVLLATLLTARLERRNPAPAWFDALLVVFAAAIVGGRLGFIIGQWSYFQEQLADIWRIWQGGLSYHAALFAGLSALLLWSGIQGRSFYQYSALFSPGLALLICFGWLACWFDGCAYGLETAIGPFSADLPDEFGVFALRYQTQLIGLVLSIVVFASVLGMYKRLQPAVMFWFSMLLISTAHLAPGLLRGDAVPMTGNLRVDLLLDGIMIAGSLLMLQYSRRQR